MTYAKIIIRAYPETILKGWQIGPGASIAHVTISASTTNDSERDDDDEQEQQDFHHRAEVLKPSEDLVGHEEYDETDDQENAHWTKVNPSDFGSGNQYLLT